MSGPFDRIVDCVVSNHQFLCIDEVVLGLVAIFQRALPEFSFFLGAPPEGQHHRHGHLAFAEIIAHALAHQACAGIIQRIVHQLEGDAKIFAIGTHAPPASSPAGQHRAASAAAANSAAVLAATTRR